MTRASLSIKTITLAICFFASFAFVSSANAQAQLYFLPSSLGVSVGDAFSVAVMVDAGEQNVNTLGAYFEYPTDMLMATGVNTSDSVLTLFAENEASGGEVKISGGKPTPGFSGVKEVAVVNFKALASGVATLDFSNNSVALSDSSNEDVLSSKDSATLTILDAGPAGDVSARESTELEMMGALALTNDEVTAISFSELPSTIAVAIGDDIFRLTIDRGDDSFLILHGGVVHAAQGREVTSLDVGDYRVFAVSAGDSLMLSLNSSIIESNYSGAAGAEGSSIGIGMLLFIVGIGFLAVLVRLIIRAKGKTK